MSDDVVFTPAEQELADQLLAEIRQTEPDYQLTLGDRVYIRAIVENKPPKFAYKSDGKRYRVHFDRLVTNTSETPEVK